VLFLNGSIGKKDRTLEAKSAGCIAESRLVHCDPGPIVAIMNSSFLFSLIWLFGLLPMDSPRSPLVFNAYFVLITLLCVPCFAQNAKTPRKGAIASNLIRPEFYAAIDFYEDAQTLQAFEGFQQALAQSRQVNGERGIDSVPPLVMMGECLLTQGDIGAALDKFESALAISIQCSGWISLISNPGTERPCRIEGKGRHVGGFE
jgi:hypothetical protein